MTLESEVRQYKNQMSKIGFFAIHPLLVVHQAFQCGKLAFEGYKPERSESGPGAEAKAAMQFSKWSDIALAVMATPIAIALTGISVSIGIVAAILRTVFFAFQCMVSAISQLLNQGEDDAIALTTLK